MLSAPKIIYTQKKNEKKIGPGVPASDREGRACATRAMLSAPKIIYTHKKKIKKK
jgi:hypothetical protein